MYPFQKTAFCLASAMALTMLVPMASAQTPGQTDGGKYQAVINSSVRVMGKMPDGTLSYGTGWVISGADKQNRAGAAIVVTARHILDGATSVFIVEPGAVMSAQRVATVKASIADRDIAFLEVKDIPQAPLPLSNSLPQIGGLIYAIGYSAASDRNENTFAEPKLGNMAKVFTNTVGDTTHAPVHQIEFDSQILPGFSGGPVVNQCAQVIGLTIKDGGHIRLGEGQNVSLAPGIAVAVSSDEIISAAHDSGIDIHTANACDAAATASGQKQPALPPPPPLCSAPFITDENGQACTAVEPKSWQKTMHQVGLYPAVTLVGGIILVAILALLVVLIAIVVVLLGRKGKAVPTPDYDRDYSNSRPLNDGGSPKTSKLFTTNAIHLTGRGPSGEAIDMRFNAEDLGGSGVMLGTEGDEGARIPDHNRQSVVSRHHASLSFDGTNFVVRDNKSTNKTKVGDETLASGASKRLVSGDRLTLANVTLNVTITK